MSYESAPDPFQTAPELSGNTPSREPRLKLVVGLTLAAAAIAGYLLIQTELLRGQPIGCGPNSGCEAVLNSRWSKIAGVSVCLPALATHVMILLCVLVIAGENSGPERGVAIAGLVLAAALLMTAASWFIAVQLFLVGSICPWCMADHALGLAIAIAILSLPAIRTIRWYIPAGLGVIAVALAAGAQHAQTEPQAVRVVDSRNSDVGTGPERVITLLGGRLKVRPHELPFDGNPESRIQIVYIFDYSCSHCRETRTLLKQVRDQSKESFSLIMLPLPLDSKCNRLVPVTRPAFQESCELSRLALAVWKAQPGQFPAYNEWLFTGEEAPAAADARAEAERLVGAEPLAAALVDKWVERQIQIHVDAYGYADQAPLPQILSSRAASLQGVPTESQVRQLIQELISQP